MASNANHVEDIERSDAKSNDDSVGQNAVESFQNEIFQEREKSFSNSVGKPSAVESAGTEANIDKSQSSGQIDKNGIKVPFPKPYEDKHGDLIKNPGDTVSERPVKASELLSRFEKKDGVSKLSTGDNLVREDGRESLYTPNGDRVTVNPDGTFKVKGDVKAIESNKNGETTITFGDGAKVTVDKEGIRSVSRANETVSFARMSDLNKSKAIPRTETQGVPQDTTIHRPKDVSTPPFRPDAEGSKAEDSIFKPEFKKEALPNLEIKKN
ncbi:MAG: hypothetical protein K2X27_06425 [Candidatus Obscuribacterales bacterium]|nr:hypothetical protein [Candidatus Obscuribacterales bacterium]